MYLVYESDSQRTFPSTVIAIFSSQEKANSFIAQKKKTCTWEVYSVELMEVDVGDYDVIYQEGKYLNVVESYELTDEQIEATLDEITEELYG